MYKNFYGFTDMPFSQNLVRDLDNVYQSENFAMTQAFLVSSLDKQITLTLVLGEFGVGKTTLIKYILQLFQQDFTSGYISARLNSTQEFFQQVLTSFGQKAENKGTYEMLLQLSFFLNSKYKEQGEQSTFLVIDDADSMAIDALKGIELLLGLNSEDYQVLQLILIGQPDLENKLNIPELLGLLESSKTRCMLEALSPEDTQRYIEHRIELAGVHNKKLFDQQACSVTYEYSKGIPGKINSICDEALLRGSELKIHEISPELVREVAENQIEISEKRYVHWGPSSLAWASGLVLGGVILALAYLPNNFISQSEDPQVIVSSKIKSHSEKIEPKALVGNTEITPNQTKKPEYLVKKKVTNTENQQNKLSTKSKTEIQLAIADRQFANLKLTTPEKDNAYENYVEILSVSPNEKRAIDGLERISNYYLGRAKTHMNKGRFEKSLVSISRGLKVSPDHEELIQLKKQVIVEAKRQQKITVLVKRAEKQINALKFTKPINDNAYKTYQDIVALNESDPQALRGLKKMLSQIKSKIKMNFDEENFSQALGLTKEIQQLPSIGDNDPFHEQAVFAAFEAKNIVDNQLNKQLLVAETHFKAGHLTLPSGNNAFESYNKALQIDPSNKDAKKGLNNLKKRYQKLVKIALSKDKTEKAIQLSNEGLNAFPGHKELLSLQQIAVLQQKASDKKAEDSISNNPLKNKDQDIKAFGTF